MTSQTTALTKTNTNEPCVGEILIDSKKISERTKEIAFEINKDYAQKNPILIGILKGAGIFISDLVRILNIPVQLEYMTVSSYGASTKTSGIVRILKDLDAEIENRHVIIVEDIIDSGLTLSYLTKTLSSRKPASLEVCSLLKKDSNQKRPVSAKYLGFTIKPDFFVVGYGLDFHQNYRNLKDIHTLKNTPTNNGY